MRGARLRLGILALVAVMGSEAVAEERRLEGEIYYRYDSLDSGFADWQAHRLDLQSSRRGEPTWYGAALRERRFGSWDEGLELGAAVPLGDDWVLQPEMGRTFGADFLPEWYADLRLQRRLPQGYVGSASLRRTQYDASRVDRLALGAERYWGNWRAAYTLNVSDVQGAGNPVGHAVALDHYYRERSLIGLRASTGREEEGLPGGQVVTSDVTAFAVRGRHWLDADWALSWELGTLSQGDLYDRHGIQLGVRRAF